MKISNRIIMMQINELMQYNTWIALPSLRRSVFCNVLGFLGAFGMDASRGLGFGFLLPPAYVARR